MNEFKGTPGPWFLEDWNEIKSDNRINGGKGVVCSVAEYGCTDDKFELNAKLIAAAPELLEALQCCEDFLSGMHSLGFGGLALVEHTRTIINKALGTNK